MSDRPEICPYCRRPMPSEVARAGGKARAASMTPEQRSELARKAAQKRWARKTEPESK